MSAECCGRGRARKRRIAAVSALVPAAALAFAVPKCPLCIAAYFALCASMLGGALDAFAAVLW